MSVVTATIRDKAGKAMPGTYELLSLDIEREVNRVPRCRLRLLDGDLQEQTFPISDSALFAPGAEVKVALRYGDEADTPVFAGLVVRHGLRLSPRGSILAVELMDKAVALTQPRKSAVHAESSDGDVIDALCTAAGLTIAKAATTAPAQHPELVQYDASDWDFILMRAEAQGMVIAVTDGAVTLAEVSAAGGATHAFTYGIDDIFDVDLETDGLYQPAAIEGVAWDAETLKTSAASGAAVAAVKKNTLGAPDGAAVAGDLGFADAVVTHAAPLDPKELQAWVDGRVARARKSMVRGRISVRGQGDVALLDAIELTGFGERFAGTSTITGIRHRVSKGGWSTDLQFGFAPELFAERRAPTGPPAGGLLPAATTLQIGVIAAFEEDPTGAFRVRVLVPGIDAAEGVVWARLTAPDAGSERGYVFFPEVGDEVVVGFLGGDPRQAVVLGSLFSKKNIPPVAAIDADNALRGIVSKSGIAIALIDGDAPVVSITTPGGHKLTMSEDKGSIEIVDLNGNSIALDDKGITLTSAKDVIVKGATINLQGSKVEAKK
ncbi:MAG: phage baseplate assembly protein V [Nannocystaceae bacterium]